MEAVVGHQDLVFYLADDTVTHHQWKRFFPGADGPDPRAVNPRLLDNYPPESPPALGLSLDLRSRMQEALKGERFLWLVGDLETPPGSTHFQEFRDLLRKQFSMDTQEDAPKQVFLLTPKR